jgi:excinuclease ABC subunit C
MRPRQKAATGQFSSQEAKDQAKAAPKAPGCYIYRNEAGQVVYVGKSKNLHSRVRQYFKKHPESDKLARLAMAIRDIEVRLAPSELDALILEHSLVKEHKPKFNSQLMDEQDPVWLRASSDPPSFSLSRERLEDGAFYFGPFDGKYEIAEALGALNAAWMTPLCGKVLSNQATPCLNYHMKRCFGPCLDCSAGRKEAEEAIRHLRGEDTQGVENLKAQMEAFSASQEYELAQRHSVALRRLEGLKKRGRLEGMLSAKRALLAIRPHKSDECSIFFFSGGQVGHRVDFVVADLEKAAERFCAEIQESREALPDSRSIARALLDIYARKSFAFLGEASVEDDRKAALSVCRELIV